MFARIYSGIFISVLLAGLLTYALYAWSYSSRRPSYETRTLAGTYQLIADSMTRQPAESRERYMEIVASLIGATHTRTSVNEPSLSLRAAQKRRLQQGSPVLVVGEGIQWCLPDGDDHCYLLALTALTEQQYRGHALLLVSELSRRDNAVSLAELRRYSESPIRIDDIASLNLDRQQISRLQRNSVVVSYDAIDDDTFVVYAPLNAKNQVVVFGPIAQFQSLPVQLVIAMLALTMALIVAVSYWLVSQLENRLAVIDSTVERFGDGDLASRVSLTGNDQIASLGHHVNAMATRIENLLTGERNLIQAVSHDFRTPLARMRFRLEMLKEQTVCETSNQRAAGLKSDIDEMQALVEEVLQHHTLGGLQTLDREWLDIPAEVGRVADALTELYPLLTIDKSSTAACRLWGNQRYINRLLQNLVDNACKHASSSVVISAIDHQKGITVVVEDDGPGISRDDRDKIFNTFFRADTSRNSQTGGYGLGLAIVKRIVKLHDAHIEVAGSGLGGAQFTIEFPLKIATSVQPHG